MKVLIWLVFYIAHYIVTLLIDSGGTSFLDQLQNITDGLAVLYGLTTAILKCGSLALCFWGAKATCKKYDWAKANKEAKRYNLSPKEYALKEFTQNEINELADLYAEQLKPRLKPMVKSGKITKSQYFLLMELDFTEFIRNE